jgi:hypothetical protein
MSRALRREVSTIETALLILGTDAVVASIATDATTAPFAQGPGSAFVLLLAAASAAWSLASLAAYTSGSGTQLSDRAAAGLLVATIAFFAGLSIAHVAANVSPASMLFAVAVLATAIASPAWSRSIWQRALGLQGRSMSGIRRTSRDRGT